MMNQDEGDKIHDEDEDALLVDSFFLPGGILDPMDTVVNNNCNSKDNVTRETPQPPASNTAAVGWANSNNNNPGPIGPPVFSSTWNNFPSSSLGAPNGPLGSTMRSVTPILSQPTASQQPPAAELQSNINNSDFLAYTNPPPGFEHGIITNGNSDQQEPSTFRSLFHQPPGLLENNNAGRSKLSSLLEPSVPTSNMNDRSRRVVRFSMEQEQEQQQQAHSPPHRQQLQQQGVPAPIHGTSPRNVMIRTEDPPMHQTHRDDDDDDDLCSIPRELQHSLLTDDSATSSLSNSTCGGEEDENAHKQQNQGSQSQREPVQIKEHHPSLVVVSAPSSSLLQSAKITTGKVVAAHTSTTPLTENNVASTPLSSTKHTKATTAKQTKTIKTQQPSSQAKALPAVKLRQTPKNDQTKDARESQQQLKGTQNKGNREEPVSSQASKQQIPKNRKVDSGDVTPKKSNNNKKVNSLRSKQSSIKPSHIRSVGTAQSTSSKQLRPSLAPNHINNKNDKHQQQQHQENATTTTMTTTSTKTLPLQQESNQTSPNLAISAPNHCTEMPLLSADVPQHQQAPLRTKKRRNHRKQPKKQQKSSSDVDNGDNDQNMMDRLSSPNVARSAADISNNMTLNQSLNGRETKIRTSRGNKRSPTKTSGTNSGVPQNDIAEKIEPSPLKREKNDTAVNGATVQGISSSGVRKRQQQHPTTRQRANRQPQQVLRKKKKFSQRRQRQVFLPNWAQKWMLYVETYFHVMGCMLKCTRVYAIDALLVRSDVYEDDSDDYDEDEHTVQNKKINFAGLTRTGWIYLVWIAGPYIPLICVDYGHVPHVVAHLGVCLALCSWLFLDVIINRSTSILLQSKFVDMTTNENQNVGEERYSRNQHDKGDNKSPPRIQSSERRTLEGQSTAISIGANVEASTSTNHFYLYKALCLWIVWTTLFVDDWVEQELPSFLSISMGGRSIRAYIWTIALNLPNSNDKSEQQQHRSVFLWTSFLLQLALLYWGQSSLFRCDDCQFASASWWSRLYAWYAYLMSCILDSLAIPLIGLATLRYKRLEMASALATTNTTTSTRPTMQ